VGPGKVAAQGFPGKPDLVGGLGDRFALPPIISSMAFMTFFETRFGGPIAAGAG
jgi:hypothetical protein